MAGQNRCTSTCGLWLWLGLVGGVYLQHHSGAMAQSPAGTTCPLDFAVLAQFPRVAQQARQKDVQCLTLLDALEMVMAEYLRNTSYFLLPALVVPACLDSYQAQLRAQGTDANITDLCEDNLPSMMARGFDNCQGIQSAADLTAIASRFSSLQSARKSCAGVLADKRYHQNVDCAACTKQLASLTADLTAFNSSGVHQGCQNYSSMYVAAEINSAGPLDPHTAACLFSIYPIPAAKKNRTGVYVAVGVIALALLAFAGGLTICYKRRRRKLAEEKAFIKRNTDLLEGSMRASDGSIMFTIEELKAATHNFSREMIIGSGAYGNVYKGILKSGVEIAIKRFKNCSPAGDKDFVHEVQMISSVRHRNLVALRGCCVASGGVVEGHQRIIVIDYLPNGSLQDYVFKAKSAPLDWPTRQKVAIGVAKGLDYLHHGVQPAILHRDIKSSNILLDADCNACVADFGLARFTPEGFTHVSTRAAGTFGYVAPEYTMYGQLTERSDVYSFGVVLLELISGRKALHSDADEFTLITDWAWALVKSGQWEAVLDPRMGNRGSGEDMERFVMLALLCAHPLVACRPNMTVALRILENDQKLPSIPDRPIPLTAHRDEVEKLSRRHLLQAGSSGTASSTSASQVFSETGFRSFGISASEGSSRLDGR